MRKLSWMLPAMLACATAMADNALQRTEQSCAKYPTPEAQAECRQKQKAALDASEAERKKNQPKLDLKQGGAGKQNDLCFTRQATGERVCPN